MEITEICMNLKIGIIGLPNVGKSTTFNALVKEQNAQVANYPFCTIEPNIAIVPVPDPRLDQLAEVVGVSKVIHATIEFVDVAGLVKGASKGEGLGNQFLGNIRNVDAVLHIVRCFDDPNVIHISEKPDPKEDIEIINTELSLADYQQVEKRIEKLIRQVKGDKNLQPVLDIAILAKDHLSEGNPLWAFPQREDPTFLELNKELQFLTAKRVIYLANLDEESIETGNLYYQTAQQISQAQNAQILKICASLEQDLITLSPQEQLEYLNMAGIEHSGLDQVIRASYEILNLISFFTFNDEEARSWTIVDGWTAPMAAGQIHTDFEKGFIRAEIADFETFIEHGNWAALKNAGKSRLEGRNYVVRDGEVILFRFNI
jgi:GTP-binding protein YchF